MLRQAIKRLLFASAQSKTPKPALSYISAEETVRNANAENLSVGDHVEKLWGQVGQSEKVIDQVLRLVELPSAPAIIEIGTGTGRYLDKLIKRITPGSYESYEVAQDWNEYLREHYKELRVYHAEGSNLSLTPDRASDLVIAHGVFTYLPFLIAMSYFNEIDRVTRVGGYCVFDCFLENCFDGGYLEKWLQSEHRYPVLLPEIFIKNQFSRFGFSFVGGFTNKYGEGISQYLVFRKNYE